MLLLAATSLLPCRALAAVSTSAPSFDLFLTNTLGDWRGASYSWQGASGAQVGGPAPKEMLPLGVAPGFVTQPTKSSTLITEVMRSCGGAVQGVEEKRDCQPAKGTVMLNRQNDGTTFFSYGSYAVAPPQLSRSTDDEVDFMASQECFGLTVSLAHADATRRRLLVVVAGDEIACCDVAMEASATQHPEAPGLEAIDNLLGRRLQCVVEANAWEGGADTLTLTGSPGGSPGSPWLNARTRWEKDVGSIDGGSPLVPANCAAYLPGGCWIQVVRSEEDGSRTIEVGSVAVEAAEVKAVAHEYSAEGALRRVSFRKVTARE